MFFIGVYEEGVRATKDFIIYKPGIIFLKFPIFLKHFICLPIFQFSDLVRTIKQIGHFTHTLPHLPRCNPGILFFHLPSNKKKMTGVVVLVFKGMRFQEWSCIGTDTVV